MQLVDGLASLDLTNNLLSYKNHKFSLSIYIYVRANQRTITRAAPPRDSVPHLLVQREHAHPHPHRRDITTFTCSNSNNSNSSNTITIIMLAVAAAVADKTQASVETMLEWATYTLEVDQLQWQMPRPFFHPGCSVRCSLLSTHTHKEEEEEAHNAPPARDTRAPRRRHRHKIRPLYRVK